MIYFFDSSAVDVNSVSDLGFFFFFFVLILFFRDDFAQNFCNDAVDCRCQPVGIVRWNYFISTTIVNCPRPRVVGVLASLTFWMAAKPTMNDDRQNVLRTMSVCHFLCPPPNVFGFVKYFSTMNDDAPPSPNDDVYIR